MAVCQTGRYRCLAVLVSSYRAVFAARHFGIHTPDISWQQELNNAWLG
jgi:hypothetical protein